MSHLTWIQRHIALTKSQTANYFMWTKTQTTRLQYWNRYLILSTKDFQPYQATRKSLMHQKENMSRHWVNPGTNNHWNTRQMTRTKIKWKEIEREKSCGIIPHSRSPSKVTSAARFLNCWENTFPKTINCTKSLTKIQLSSATALREIWKEFSKVTTQKCWTRKKRQVKKPARVQTTEKIRARLKTNV